MKVLFVDDEDRVLEGLRRMLFDVATEWEPCFALSAAQALEMLKDEDVHVLVTDMRMPGMSGITLLEHVAKMRPGVSRIVLSGQAQEDEGLRLRIAALAHQFLAKPCSAGVLQDAIARAVELRELLNCEACRNAIGGVGRLPAAPRLFTRISAMITDPRVDIGAVARVVAQEPMIAAKVLQLVNSAFFARASKVTDVLVAARRLGLAHLRAVVLSTELFGAPCRGLSTHEHDELQREAQVASALAAEILRGDSRVEDARTAALLANVGTLILAASAAEMWLAVKRMRGEGEAPLEAERKVLGVTHAEVGAYVLAQWGLPDAIVEGVARHHSPGAVSGRGFGVVGAVYVATALAAGDALDEAYLGAVGVLDRVEGWTSLLLRSTREEES